MKIANGLIICGVVFWASNLFADSNWVLWKSTKAFHLASIAMLSIDKKAVEDSRRKKWEYVDAFQNKKECQVAREEKLNKFVSLQNEWLKKKIDEKKANEAAAKKIHLPLDKRFPAYKQYIELQREFGRNDKDIEISILENIEKKKKTAMPNVVRLNEDEEVYISSEASTWRVQFQCIPDTIDPRMKG